MVIFTTRLREAELRPFKEAGVTASISQGMAKKQQDMVTRGVHAQRGFSRGRTLQTKAEIVPHNFHS